MSFVALPWSSSARVMRSLIVFRPDLVEGSVIMGTLAMVCAPDQFWAGMQFLFPTSPKLQEFKIRWQLIAPKAGKGDDSD